MAILIAFIVAVLMARVVVGFYLTKRDAGYVDDNCVVRYIIDWVNKFISKKK